MSVITVADISYRPDAGWPEAGLPDRIWEVSQESTGDASGGSNSIQVNLKAAGVPPGNLFSLENIAVRHGASGVVVGNISTSGMRTAAPGFDVSQYNINLIDDPTGAISLGLLNEANPRLFLGRGASAGTAGTVTFTFVNTTVIVLRVVASGYMWTPGAINAVGGVRRPLSGLFSN